MSKNKDCRKLIPAVAQHIGVWQVTSDWHGVDAVMPLLDRMRQEGAVVIIKLDGERGPRDTGAYTLIVSSPLLDKSGTIRIDSDSIEIGLAYVIVTYAKQCWGIVDFEESNAD